MANYLDNFNKGLAPTPTNANPTYVDQFNSQQTAIPAQTEQAQPAPKYGEGLDQANVPTVYDAKTFTPVPNLTPDQVSQGIIDGSLVLQANQKIKLHDTDGNEELIDANDTAHKLSQGYSFQSKKEAITEDELAKPENQGIAGEFRQGIKSFGNQLLGGVPGIVSEANESPEDKLRRETRENSNKIGQYIGGSLGLAGNIGATEGLGGFAHIGQIGDIAEHAATGFDGAKSLITQALSKSTEEGTSIATAGAQIGAEKAQQLSQLSAQAPLAKRLLGTAINQATQGAILSSPQALAQALTGDPQKAAETLGWGLGTGMFLGGASELLSSAAKATGSVMTSDPAKKWMDQTGANMALRSAGFSKPMLNKLSPGRAADIANYLQDNGLLDSAEGRQHLGELTEAVRKKVGASIGASRQALDDLVSNNKLENYAIQPFEISQYLKEKLGGPDLLLKQNSQLKDALDMLVEDSDTLGQRRGYVTMDEFQHYLEGLQTKWSPQISKAVNNGGLKGLDTVTPLDAMKRAAYATLRAFGDIKADNILKGAQELNVDVNPNMVKELVKSRQEYSILTDLQKASYNLDAQDAANRMVGLTDFLHMGNGIASTTTGLVGSAVGGAVGGFPGAYIGKSVGKAAGIPLDFFLKKWAENTGLIKLSSALRNAAKDGSTVFSAVMSADAEARLKQTLSQTNDIILRVAQKSTQPLANTSINPIQHLLGDTTGLSKDQQKTKLQEQLANLQSNPQQLALLTSHATAPIAEANPQVAEALQQHQTNKINYLASHIPQLKTQLPFAPKPSKPTQEAWDDFNDKAEVAINPFAVMHHFENGTLNNNHLDALNTLYPSMKSEFINSLMNAHLDNPELELPQQHLTLLSKLTGTQLDPLAPYYNSIQSQWQPTQSDTQGKAPAKTRKVNLKSTQTNSTFANLSGPNNNAK